MLFSFPVFTTVIILTSFIFVPSIAQNVNFNFLTLNQNITTSNYRTLFVAEFIRHGARSHYEDNVPASFFGGIQKGHLTEKGRIESLRIGMQRRNEYVNTKKFLKEDQMRKEIVSISTFKERCLDTGKLVLQGMYPFQDLTFKD